MSTEANRDALLRLLQGKRRQFTEQRAQDFYAESESLEFIFGGQVRRELARIAADPRSKSGEGNG